MEIEEDRETPFMPYFRCLQNLSLNIMMMSDTASLHFDSIFEFATKGITFLQSFDTDESKLEAMKDFDDGPFSPVAEWKFRVSGCEDATPSMLNAADWLATSMTITSRFPNLSVEIRPFDPIPSLERL